MKRQGVRHVFTLAVFRKCHWCYIEVAAVMWNDHNMRWQRFFLVSTCVNGSVLWHSSSGNGDFIAIDWK